jgi:hypothetical protein
MTPCSAFLAEPNQPFCLFHVTSRQEPQPLDFSRRLTLHEHNPSQ